MTYYNILGGVKRTVAIAYQPATANIAEIQNPLGFKTENLHGILMYACGPRGGQQGCKSGARVSAPCCHVTTGNKKFLINLHIMSLIYVLLFFLFEHTNYCPDLTELIYSFFVVDWTKVFYFSLANVIFSFF